MPEPAIEPPFNSPEGARGVVGEPGSTWPTSGRRNVPPTPVPPAIEPPFNSLPPCPDCHHTPAIHHPQHGCGLCPCTRTTAPNWPTDESPFICRFAYADPPYVGCSALYPEHPDSARWDDPTEHVALMWDLERDYDGWALSASAPSLAHLLPGAPPGTRVAAWVKPFAAYKRNVRVAYTWEPVLWRRVRERRPGEPVGRDHLSCPITMKRGLTGAKPEPFAAWLRVLLGWVEGDELDDLFPGSGAITRAMDIPRLGL